MQDSNKDTILDNAYDDKPQDEEPKADTVIDKKSKKGKKKEKKMKTRKGKKDAPSSSPMPEDAPKDDIDNTQQEDVNSKKKKGKKTKKDKKDKKPMKKSSKITIIVVSVILAIAIIATSIAVPIVIINKDKIFVSKAEDFKDTDGKYYVLQNDLTIDDNVNLDKISKLDLNGKVLTINGTLTINNTTNDAVLLGSIKDVNAKADGKLLATNIVIESNAPVYLNTQTDVSNITINASSVTFGNALSSSENIDINCETVTIRNNVKFIGDNGASKVLNINNAKTVQIDGKIGANLNLFNDAEYDTVTQITSTSGIVGNLTASSNNIISLDASVTGVIKASNNGIIKKVKLLEHAVITNEQGINGVDELLVFHKLVPPYMTNVNSVQVIRPLERIGYITTNEDNGIIELEFASVVGADSYLLTIDGGEPISIAQADFGPNQPITYDITNYVVDPTTHFIDVQAISEENGELYLPSPIMSYEYTTNTVLDRTSNIRVEDEMIPNPDYQLNEDGTPVDPTIPENIKSGRKLLSFDKVNFANKYEISINGTKFTSETFENIDITDKLDHAGSYVISIVAKSDNDNIKDSRNAMYHYDHYVKLDDIKVSITDEEDNNINIQFVDKDGNAYLSNNVGYFEVELTIAGTSEPIIYRTSNTSMLLKRLENNVVLIPNGSTIKVTAVSFNPYYKESVSDIFTYNKIN